MVNSRTDEIVRCLRSIREAVDKLQELLDAPQEETLERYYRRRRDLLTRLFAAGGLDQPGLFRMLDEHDTPHQWIGQQVKAGYMEVVPWPGGSDRYVATRKAVQEFSLQEEAEAFATIAADAVEADWDTEEDAKYDRA